MTYFGGLGAGKGWLRFVFLVEPEVIRDILAAVQPVLLLKDRRGPAHYNSTLMREFLEAYSRYLDAMLESPDAAQAASLSVYAGLASSPDKFSMQPCPDEGCEHPDSDEPGVALSPEMLHYDATRGQVCTNVLSRLYFGAALSFPRVISLERENFEILHDTTASPAFGLFQSLKARIQQVTRPCKLRSPAREHRTAIRITEQMRVKMRSHPGLRGAKLEII